MTEQDKSILDKAKDVASGLKEKVTGFVGEHEEQIDNAIDKTGHFVDEKLTKGRFSEKIDKAQDAAKGAVGKIGGNEDDDGKTDTGESEPGSES
jgi:hypothetical protein